MSEQTEGEPDQGDETVEPAKFEVTEPEYEIFEKGEKQPRNGKTREVERDSPC